VSSTDLALIADPATAAGPDRSGPSPARRRGLDGVRAILTAHKVATFGLALFLVIVVVAILAPIVSPHSPYKQNLGDNFLPPMWSDGGSATYPLGTDPLGRDLLSRMLFGARYSLLISALSVVLGSAIGFTIGVVAGFWGGKVDTVLMRLGDIQLAFPFVLFAIAVLAVSIERTVWQIILVLGISSWVLYARVVRSRVLTEREKDYATAARALGASHLRVLTRYLLPNVWQVLPPIALLNLGFFVIVESLLSFLSLGLSPPTPSWGSILADGRQFMMISPWMALLPGFSIIVTVLSISLAADGFNDLIDPTLARGSFRRIPLPGPGHVSGPDADDPLLAVRDLSTQFPTRDGVVHAVEGVDLRLRRGEVLGVVGESGSGKSTLGLSIIQLLDPPGRVISGQVLFEWRDLVRVSNRVMTRVRGRRIGMIFQDPSNSMTPVLTVGFQLREALRASGPVSRDQADRVTRQALVAVHIADPDRVLRSYPFELSGGMQQRVMIALAMIRNPDLLILDEPTSALDVTTQAQLLEELDRIRRDRGTSVLFITHDIALLNGFADRILVMYGGEVCEDGPERAVLRTPQHPYTRALLSAVERTGVTETGRLAAIPGDPPDPKRPLPGCPFAPRCPHAMEICRVSKPPRVKVGPTHQAACHLLTAYEELSA
jgi:peptide/nickel transport system permease protein